MVIETSSASGSEGLYRCRSAVLLIIFNRSDVAARTLKAIARVRPERLYIAGDGPRPDVRADASDVAEARDTVLSGVDWDCEVHTLFRKENLGCKRGVSTAIDWFLDSEGEGIILEDDCVPVPGFFAFCDWGLGHFRGDDRVGSISGSNLVADIVPIELRNTFSALMSPWGWATWRRAWRHYTGVIDSAGLRAATDTLRARSLSWWQVLYWRTQFRHSADSDSIWDMVFQHSFFVHELVSVVPAWNLVENVGFGPGSTHTRGSAPRFVTENLPPDPSLELLKLPADDSGIVNVRRDDVLAATIWRCTPFGTLRFVLGTAFRMAIR